MKTEQEQIEEIQEIIGDSYEYDFISAELGSGDGYINIEEAAKAIVEAGYGDVSAYKAEIERLRTTLGQYNTELNSALESLKSQCREIGELKAKVKQAQIDILNKAKEKFNAISRELGNDCDLCGVSAVCSCRCEIDKLIKEVQNEQKD